MASYVNDLRLKEIGTGESSGTWGSETNTNLELIGDALGFGTEAITTNADTHTTTVADGSADAGRAMYIKYTGTLDSACTITIGPNTINRMHFIENATTGSQNIIISQGTGSNVTIPAGDVKAVYLDGAGSGAAVADAFTDLNLAGTTTVDALNVSGALTGSSTIQGTTITATTAFVPDASDGAALGTSSLEFSDLFLADAAVINLGDDQDTTLTHVADTGILLNSTRQLQFGDSGTYIHQSADGVLDLVSDTEIEINATTIDMNGNADISGTLGVTGTITFGDSHTIGNDADDNLLIAGSANENIIIDSADDIILDADGSTISMKDGGTTRYTFNLDSTPDLVMAGGNASITASTSDADFTIIGNDGGSDINALTFDMSAAGAATFNSSATFGGNIIGEDIKASGSGGLTLQTDEGTKRLVITDAGNVGIGTTSPAEMLHVTGDIRVDTDLILQPTKILYLDGGNDTYINEVAANEIGFNTAGAERVRIDSSGRVGVGTTSPDSPLEIDGGSSANTVLHLTSTTANTFLKISDSNTNEGNFIGCTTDDLTFFTRNSEKMRVTSTGAIGLGTTPPTDTHTGWTQLFIGQKGSVISENATGVHGLDGTFVTDNMYVDSDTGAFAYIEANESSAYRQEAGNHQFFTHASGSAGAAVTLSEKARIDSSGSIGVGTTSPGCVSGGIHAVHANAEGTPTFDGGEVLILQRNFNSSQSCSMSMVAGTNAACTINMGDKDDVNRSFITSHQGTDTMGFTVATGSALEIVSGRGGGSGRTVSATGNGGLCFGSATTNTGGCLMAAADNAQSEGIVFYLTASASEWQPASIVAHCSKIDSDQSDHNYGNVAYGFSILGNGTLATVQKYEENPSGGAGITWSLNDLGGTTTMQIQILATSANSTGPRIVLSAWAANYSGVLEANRS